jgi:hypothetical protein
LKVLLTFPEIRTVLAAPASILSMLKLFVGSPLLGSLISDELPLSCRIFEDTGEVSFRTTVIQ